MNKLNFDLYKVPEQLEYVCELANQMILVQDDPTQLLKRTYKPELIEHIDAEDLRDYAALITYEKAKIIIGGKDLLSKEAIVGVLGEPLTPIQKDHWFKTSYRLYQKPLQDD